MIYLTNIDLNQNELQNAVLQPLATAPTSPKLGQIYCDSTNYKIKWYNGATWKTVGAVVNTSDTNGHIVVDDVDMTVYELPVATNATLGGVMVGSGLEMVNDHLGVDKTKVAYAGTIDYQASSVSQLKLHIDGMVNDPANPLKLHGIYQGAMQNFTDGNGFTDDVEYMVIVNSINNPIIIFTSRLGKAWFCYARPDYRDGPYTDIVYPLSNEQANWLQTDDTANDFIKNKPTALSSFTNDLSFIDNTVNSLTNYYKKSETYTQSEVNTLIGNIATIQIAVVDALPLYGETNVIYLTPKINGSSPNAKDEFLWTGSQFEKIGDTEIDLSGYATHTEMEETYAAQLTIGTLTAGQTTVSVPYTGTYCGCTVFDELDGSNIMADISVTNNSVTVSISVAYTHNLTVSILSSKPLRDSIA